MFDDHEWLVGKSQKTGNMIKTDFCLSSMLLKSVNPKQVSVWIVDVFTLKGKVSHDSILSGCI